MTSENNLVNAMANSSGNFRNPTINEPRIFGGPYSMQTPVGTVMTPQAPPLPTLPPRPFAQQMPSYGTYGGPSSMYGNSLYSSPYNSSPYNSYGYGTGLNSYGSFGSYGGFGGGYNSGAYNRVGNFNGNALDPHNRFIQFAEESSQPAFDSIASLVGAIGNIASMLDSTFFAITSSFRAIIQVAVNFGRLRGVFAQFWLSFGIFRRLSWLFNKILYWLRISNVDPPSAAFIDAYSAAQAESIPDVQIKGKKASLWPILVFISFIFTAPYIIMKLLGSVTSSAFEETKNPRSWVNPIRAQVKYDFQATNEHEISIRSGQEIYIAPREIQHTQKLLNTGWVLATLDNQTSGIIPLNYVQGPQKVDQTPPTTMSPVVEENQPKIIPATAVDHTKVSENEPMVHSTFPSIDSIKARTADEIMQETFAKAL